MSALEPIPEFELIRDVVAKGRADGLGDEQLAAGVYVVLVSHGYLPDHAARRLTVGQLYDHARRRIGDGGDRFEFRAVRDASGAGMRLSASQNGGAELGDLYFTIERGTGIRPDFAPIPTDYPVPEGLEGLVRELVDRIRRARPAA